MRRIASLKTAAAFVDRAGIALIFPKPDVVLPSLWDAVSGGAELAWSIRDEDGAFVSFTPEMARVWAWKDELPAENLCAAGKHVRGWPGFVSFAVLPSLYALTGRSGAPDDFRAPGLLSPLESDIAECVLEGGALHAPEIRKRIGTRETAKVNRAIDMLQKLLVLTRAGVEEREHGWPAGTVDILARRHRRHLRRLPAADAARATIATTILDSAGGAISAADLSAATGWKRSVARATLESIAGLTRLDDGVQLFSRSQTRQRAR